MAGQAIRAASRLPQTPIGLEFPSTNEAGIHMRRLMLIAAAMVFLGAAAMLSAADTKTRSERGRLTYQIVMNWSGVVRGQYGRDVRLWANEMVPRFARAPIGHLRNAARARTFEEMNDALLGVPVAEAKGPRAASRFLGELDKD